MSDPTLRDLRNNFHRCKRLAEDGNVCSHAELVLLLLYAEEMQETLIAAYASEEYAMSRVHGRLHARTHRSRRGTGADHPQG